MNAVPSQEQLAALLGEPAYALWTRLCARIEKEYEMDRRWVKGGKAWTYGYQYRRGGKTLCTLFARETAMGFMVILGKEERQAFESGRDAFTKEVQDRYDQAQTYHDGKWILFEPADDSLFDDFLRLLHIKRRPNRAKNRG